MVNDSVMLDGCPTFNVGHDPVLAESGAKIIHSLQAGWSLVDGRLTVFADRLGMIPIYYRVGDAQIVVSDSIVELASRSPDLEIDLFEVYAFWKLGFYLGSATPFVGVQRLRLGEMIVWERGTLTRSLPPKCLAAYVGTRQHAIVEAQELFAQAIRKRIHSHLRLIVPLSGGRDSRHILLELSRQRTRGLQAVTVRYLHDYPEEIRLGSLVANATSVPHIVLTVDHRQYFRHLAEQMSINNLETNLHDWMRPLTEKFSGRSYFLFDGIGGDALLNSAYAHVLPAGMSGSVLSGDIERMADTFAGDFEPPKHLRPLPDTPSFTKWLKSRLIDEISRHEGAPDIMCRFMFEHRTRRATGAAPIAVLGRVAQVGLPYLDEALVKFAYQLPASDYWKPGFHDEIIARYYPALTRIPFEDITLRAHSRIQRRIQFPLMCAYVPVLLRSFKSTIVKRFHAISRFFYYCLRFRMPDYFYITDNEVYYQTLRELTKGRTK